jgi:hypothetical protein
MSAEFNSSEKSENSQQIKPNMNYEEMIARLKATEGYLSTFLKENMNKEMTMTQELEKIKQTSRQVQEEIRLTSKQSIDNLQNVTELHKKSINSNLEILAGMIKRMESQLEENRQTVQEKLDNMTDSMDTQVHMLRQQIKNNLDELEDNSKSMISSAKVGLVINGWLDWMKYGLGAAVFVVPVYLLIKWMFGLSVTL